MTQISVPSLDHLSDAAQQVLRAIGSNKIVAFHADMGVGKTTLIAEMARLLGVREDVANSPSFAIVNQYELPAQTGSIFHFDCYRLRSVEEALDIGIEDYLYSGNLCLIEWPQNIEEILPDDTLHIYMEENPLSHARTITID